MITNSMVLRLRSLARFANRSQNEVELANALGCSPAKATAAVQTLRQLVEAFPPPKKAKHGTNKSTAV